MKTPDVDALHSVLQGMMGARHLSQIKEETESREHSGCVFPPIVPQQRRAAERQEVGRACRQEVMPVLDPAEVALPEQQRALLDNKSLLEELSRIEADLSESLRLDMERQQEADFLRQQENRLRWENLSYLRLNQRVTKPWVSSYFRKFPMHIYCLPVQAANHRGRRWGKRRKI